MNFGDGSKIDSWITFNLRDTYTDPIGQLDFITAPPRDKIAEYLVKLKKGEIVTIFVNEVNQGGFIITSTKQLIGVEQGTIFQITCKSPLVTAQEGSIDPLLSFKKQTDSALGVVILKALLPYGFDLLIADALANVSALTGKGINGTGGKIDMERLKLKEAQAQEGEKAYQFCARLLSRRGVAMRLSAEGTLLLTAPNYDQEAAYSLVQDFDGSHSGDRFFGTIEVTDTNDEQYSECRVRGRSADRRHGTHTGPVQAIVKSTDISASRPPYSGGTGATYKRLEILDKDCRDAEQCRNVAKHALGYRARNAFTVTGQVDGLVSKTGRIWQVDTIAHVIVEASNINEEMWIAERVLQGDTQGGQSTRLTLIPKGALVLGDDVQ
jgi:hypothetical protein